MRYRSNQTSTVSYCLWDTYALTLVLKKINYLGNIKSFVSFFNTPVSWIIHKNPTNWITLMMLNQFYKNGYAFSYSKFEKNP